MSDPAQPKCGGTKRPISSTRRTLFSYARASHFIMEVSWMRFIRMPGKAHAVVPPMMFLDASRPSHLACPAPSRLGSRKPYLAVERPKGVAWNLFKLYRRAILSR